MKKDPAYSNTAKQIKQTRSEKLERIIYPVYINNIYDSRIEIKFNTPKRENPISCYFPTSIVRGKLKKGDQAVYVIYQRGDEYWGRIIEVEENKKRARRKL